MAKQIITENTIIIIGKSISLGAYMDFFRKASGKDVPPDFQGWINSKAGKTIKEALATYADDARPKTMTEKLSEERFVNISKPDKAFIIEFDRTLETLGFDYGNSINGGGDGYGIAYGKTGTKSRPCPARVEIKANGEILLRMYFKNIDKHRQYIENAAQHIKDAFAIDWGDCQKCMATCKSMKVYSIDGKLYDKCCHSIAFFQNPTLEKLPDYIALYLEFNPTKKPGM